VVARLDGETGGINVAERNDYYPMGLRWNVVNMPVSFNRYTFSGKEEQYDFNLPLLDFGFRMYDPVIGRWTTTDLLAELYHSYTPYNYVLGNPIRYNKDTKKEEDD
jgi:RHS repeat-associated protein